MTDTPTMKAQKKRTGRPPKRPNQGKRPSVSLRVRGALYHQISEAARKNGRSLSEEMEAKVEEAFSDDARRIARAKVEEEQTAEFGGKFLLWVGKCEAQLFKESLREVASEKGVSRYTELDMSSALALTDKLMKGQAKIVQEYFDRADTAKAQAGASIDIDSALKFFESSEGAPFRKIIEDRIARALNPKEPASE